jgi:hypothetical protein
MMSDLSTPPLRDLPPSRLAQRREHLLFEISRERESNGALERVWPSRWRRPGRRGLVALAAGVLVVAVGSASALAVRAFVLDRGFLGLPPVGATASTPESGELVLQGDARSASVPNQYRQEGQFVGALVRFWVFADGRVIWDRREQQVPEGAKEFESGLLEQRLTPEGVELLRSELVASGLFDRDLTLVVPDSQLTPGGLEALIWGWAEAPRDGRLVHLSWRSPFFSEPGLATATPEQVSALRWLDALFGDPQSVLPSSAWAVRKVRAYVPSRYRVCISSAPPTEIAHLLSLLPARAEELLRDQSWTRSEGDLVEGLGGGRTKVVGREVDYCSDVPTEKAREVGDALSGLEPDTRFRTNGLAYVVAEPVGSVDPTAIGLEPLLPHGDVPHGGG